MSSWICWHDGEFKTLDQVKISIFDFGFIHSEATYDVFKMYDGKPQFADLHLERFKKSCDYYGFTPFENVMEIVQSLSIKNVFSNSFVWLCAWRGRPPTGSPRDVNGPQHSLIYLKPYYPLSEKPSLRLTIHHDHKRVPDACYGQEFKNFGWIEFTFAQKAAIAHGFDSAILMSTTGYLTEGPGFGICFVQNGKIITPLRDCLKSVTIQVVEKICKDHGIPFLRKDINPNEVYTADEAFACSTSGGITLISQIDNATYNDEFTQKIKGLFDEYSVNGC